MLLNSIQCSCPCRCLLWRWLLSYLTRRTLLPAANTLLATLFQISLRVCFVVTQSHERAGRLTMPTEHERCADCDDLRPTVWAVSYLRKSPSSISPSNFPLGGRENTCTLPAVASFRRDARDRLTVAAALFERPWIDPPTGSYFVWALRAGAGDDYMLIKVKRWTKQQQTGEIRIALKISGSS